MKTPCTLEYVLQEILLNIREDLMKKKKMFSFGIARITSPPQFGQLVPLFLDVKNDVLTRITESSNDDYGSDGSENCDYNLVDDNRVVNFGVKNDQKVYA